MPKKKAKKKASKRPVSKGSARKKASSSANSARKKAVKKSAARKPASKVKKKAAGKKVARKKAATRKTARKAVKKSARKAVKKSARKAVKKSAKKAVKKSAKKAVKKSAKKATKKSAARASKPATSRAKPRSGKQLARAEMARFREMLLEKRLRLVGDLESMESQAFKTSGQDSSANHMADFGSDNYEQEFTLGLIENNEEVLLQINEALTRIDRGAYGVCEGCGQPIPAARLEVLPWAGFCVRCQEQQERF